jgi:hypothetical protein
MTSEPTEELRFMLVDGKSYVYKFPKFLALSDAEVATAGQFPGCRVNGYRLTLEVENGYADYQAIDQWAAGRYGWGGSLRATVWRRERWWINDG